MLGFLYYLFLIEIIISFRLKRILAILIGGWLLLLADTIGRNLVDPDGIPAGIMVALIGAPYFMYLLLKK
ncbi:MAG: iron chelate uptake ABC transporter family permease subunit [Bacillota bacterium]